MIGGEQLSVLIIGGGHNGLVLATLLARSGFHVTVHEARSKFGGAATNHVFDCGCCLSRAANYVRLLDLEVLYLIQEVHDLTLDAILSIPEHQTLIRTRQGDLVLRDLQGTAFARDLAHQSSEEAEAIFAFLSDLERASASVSSLWTDPCATKQQFRDSLVATGAQLPQLFLEGSLEDVANYYFRNELVSFALVGLANLVADTWSLPGSAFCLLYLSGGNLPFSPAYALPIGGMGRLSELLRATAVSAGVVLISESKVAVLKIEGERVHSVVLQSGQEATADIYVSAIGPAATERLCHTSSGNESSNAFGRHVYETGGAKLSCMVPREAVVVAFGMQSDWPGQIVLCESPAKFHKASQDAAWGHPSDDPLVELTLGIPGQTLPCSDHVPLSIYSLFFPYDWCVLKGREATAAEIQRRVVGTVSRWYPGLAETLSVMEILTPLDCETEFGMWRGDVDHGSMAYGNIVDGRGYGQLPHGSTPLANLYNCSAGIHPGGLVSGRPGIVCAQSILRHRLGSL